MRIAGGPSLTLRHGSALIGALLALGCSEEATGPRPVPVGIVVASAAEQVGTAGEPLDSMLTAFVYDKFGDPVPGVLVRFSVPAGNGSVTPGARTTGPDGQASAAWLLPTRTGSYQAHAAAGGLSPRSGFVQHQNLPDLRQAALASIRRFITLASRGKSRVLHRMWSR